MMRTLRALACLTVALHLTAGAAALAAEVRVPAGSTHLADAVAGANPGDRLILSPGVHRAPVVIDKAISLEGEPGAIVDAQGEGTVIKVTASGASVRRLTVRGSGKRGETFDSGIFIVRDTENVVVEENTLEGNLFGIVLHGSKKAVARNNRIANRNDLWLNDRGNGIHIWNNAGSLIEGNTVTSGRDGIYIEISHDNVIRANRFEGMRFAIHYMYANNNEVSGNISIRNHVGFALMYSKNLKVFGNVSVSDLQHGLMLHTTHRSQVRDNFIFGTGEKCLFVYTSANNDIHDNRFEQCGVGVHFTGGSENNKFHGNRFIANEFQVKYTGLKVYEWSENGRGNYWSDNPAFDTDGNGLADAAYRPNTLIDWVLWMYPLSKLLISSPAFQSLRFMQAQLPALYPGGAIDSYPLMTPGEPPVPLPRNVDLTPAPRDPAQAGSDQRPIM